ncbi:hypothetical protein HGRIS_006319 [Hohenbuehelia grisea]|uniref:Hydrophobin n=1 Tax=Hohenbuehelia grisea TaxID=104357 RepID=A0ABR3K2C3_9AGAR
MFSKIIVASFAVAAFVSATPVPPVAENTCTATAAGIQKCCNGVISHTDPEVKSAFAQKGNLDFDIEKVIGDIYIGCAVGGGCDQVAVCCNNISSNSTTGLIDVAANCDSLNIL